MGLAMDRPLGNLTVQVGDTFSQSPRNQVHREPFPVSESPQILTTAKSGGMEESACRPRANIARPGSSPQSRDVWLSYRLILKGIVEVGLDMVPRFGDDLFATISSANLIPNSS